ncbi:hypothetical protein CASFOL_012237 [Castilleja foliolosa]|uniref:Uncharacterized protein n=1 Tax=Castilleja foliolosa TaxID=1961234 RepID=A0ABD3DTW3_9LAMI
MESVPIFSSLIPCSINQPSTRSFNATQLITFYGSNQWLLSKQNNPKTAILLPDRNIRSSSRASAVIDIHTAAAPAEITWEIVVGALGIVQINYTCKNMINQLAYIIESCAAGVAPFVVAGILFNKRIVAQRKCNVCKGSGLVLREKYYFRCPACEWVFAVAILEKIFY